MPKKGVCLLSRPRFWAGGDPSLKGDEALSTVENNKKNPHDARGTGVKTPPSLYPTPLPTLVYVVDDVDQLVEEKSYGIPAAGA